MSCNYADGLSPCKNKGKVGMAEIFDPPDVLKQKIQTLAAWIKESKYTVFHTGAGISTSAGIPDFRGPNGVWTLQKQGKKPKFDLDFNDAKPTVTHMAIKSLLNKGYAKYVVSQNIDGLHLKSGLLRSNVSEVHGNMFTMKCNECQKSYVSKSAVKTVGQRSLDLECVGTNKDGSQCKGILHDTILDWHHHLPPEELELAELHSGMADLCICLGSSLQIQPINLVPFNTKKNKGKVVICNLQKTKCDWKCDLIIHTYVDDLMISLMKILKVDIEKYDETLDPTVDINLQNVDWTIHEYDLRNLRNMKKNCMKSRKRNNGKIEIKPKPCNDNLTLKQSKIPKINNINK